MRLSANFQGKSQVFKLEGKYYLLLINETKDSRTTASIERYLHEFGQKHTSSGLSVGYLRERGEEFIASNAVHKLRQYFLS
jgi:negative regulator of genetic competence, sporulation and motility